MRLTDRPVNKLNSFCLLKSSSLKINYTATWSEVVIPKYDKFFVEVEVRFVKYK